MSPGIYCNHFPRRECVSAGKCGSGFLWEWQQSFSPFFHYQTPPPPELPVPFLEINNSEIQAELDGMSVRQKLAQLIILEIDSVDSKYAISRQDSLEMGGMILQNWEVDSLIKLARKISASQIPLLGVGALKSDPVYYSLPTHKALLQIAPDSVLELAARSAAYQLKNWGFHFQLYPTGLDFFSNRSQEKYSEKLSSINIQYQLQHSLFMLDDVSIYYPRMRDSVKRDSMLFPYKRVSKSGLSCMILNEGEVEKIHPGSYRKALLRRAARQSLGFEGLVISRFPDKEDNLDAWIEQFVKGGSEMLVVSDSLGGKILDELQSQFNQGRFLEEDLNQRIRRILKLKKWAGVLKTREEKTPDVVREFDLFPISPAILNKELNRASFTLIRDREDLIPLRKLGRSRIHILYLGEKLERMEEQIEFYTSFSSSKLEFSRRSDTFPALDPYDYRRYRPLLVVLNINELDTSRHHSFVESLIELEAKKELILINTGKLENLLPFADFSQLIQVYQTDSLSQQQLGQALFGGEPFRGIFPIDLGDKLFYGQGKLRERSRLGYALAEEVGMNSFKLSKIDSVVTDGLYHRAMPGCQVMVIRKGMVVYDKSFGYQTYSRRRKVQPTDVYDIASITKVAGTTLAAMRMVDKGKLRLSARVGRYFRDKSVIRDSIAGIDTSWAVFTPIIVDSLAADSTRDSLQQLVEKPRIPKSTSMLRVDTFRRSADSLMVIKTRIGGRIKTSSPVLNLRISDLLTHHSGLPAGIPIRDFVLYTRYGLGRYAKYFSPTKSSKYPIEVANRFWLRSDYKDSLWQRVKALEVAPRHTYKYSDANMVLVQQAIDSVNGYGIDSFLMKEIYKPMGLRYLRYKPKNYFRNSQIVPTENDRWRNQLLRGYVHDPTAALFGGVAGNAGLFANAHDMGHLFQMLLQNGRYGEERYIQAGTIQDFTSIKEGNRAYGFDMVGSQGNAFAAWQASPSTFGHTGFTGTCVWVDPEEDLIYIFLTNRIHPRASNWTLNERRIRQRIHEAIYEAITKDNKESELASQN
jgi:beta-N-acetylhexosaminidase